MITNSDQDPVSESRNGDTNKLDDRAGSLNQESDSINTLIVEDNGMVVAQILKYLKSSGCNVVNVMSGGEEALEWCGSNGGCLDFAVVDYDLADEIKGTEILAFLNNEYPSVITILVSGMNRDKLNDKGREYNADATLAKPFQASDINEFVEEFF